MLHRLLRKSVDDVNGRISCAVARAQCVDEAASSTQVSQAWVTTRKGRKVNGRALNAGIRQRHFNQTVHTDVGDKSCVGSRADGDPASGSLAGDDILSDSRSLASRVDTENGTAKRGIRDKQVGGTLNGVGAKQNGGATGRAGDTRGCDRSSGMARRAGVLDGEGGQKASIVDGRVALDSREQSGFVTREEDLGDCVQGTSRRCRLAEVEGPEGIDGTDARRRVGSTSHTGLGASKTDADNLVLVGRGDRVGELAGEGSGRANNGQFSGILGVDAQHRDTVGAWVDSKKVLCAISM